MHDNRSFAEVRALACTAGSLILACLGVLCNAQESGTKISPDPQIAAAIKQVSPDCLRQTIEKLVSFQSRSTFSAQDEGSIKAGKGIGAAREWITPEFERYSKDCGGKASPPSA